MRKYSALFTGYVAGLPTLRVEIRDTDSKYIYMLDWTLPIVHSLSLITLRDDMGLVLKAYCERRECNAYLQRIRNRLDR